MSQNASLPRILCESHPHWVKLFERAWEIAIANIYQPPAPNWKPQMTCMPGVDCLWVWDSCFMTFFSRYSNGLLPGMNNLDNLYRLQSEDGLITMAYRPSTEEPAYGERINPPLFAWAELLHWRFTGDDSRLAPTLPRLVRLFDWIKNNRRRKSGLYWFEDSGSTGMDNSPRSGYLAEFLNGSDICHIDLIAQQALTAECLTTIAAHLGDHSLADRFRTEHEETTRLLDRHHWDKRSGFYYDVFDVNTYDRMNYLNHKTAASFWPMISGNANPQQVDSLLKHLLDPEEFWTLHPVATLSRKDPNYDPKGGYWLGGVWAPTNYMISKGLQRHGRADVAKELAVKHLECMAEVLSSHHSIFECYAPDFPQPATGKCDDEPVRSNFVGWSGLGPVAMLIEDVIGLDFDAPRRRVTWNVTMDGLHGIENLIFLGGPVSLRCRRSQKSTEVEVESSADFELILKTPDKKEPTICQVQPGKQQFAC